MHAIDDIRARPFTPQMNGERPAFIDVRTPYGTARVGVSREDAAEFLESTLFTGGLVVVSVSAWGDDAAKRPADYAEVLATLHQVFGPDVLPKLRRVVLGGGAVYFMGMVDDSDFVAPTMLQDAALARRFDAEPALP